MDDSKKRHASLTSLSVVLMISQLITHDALLHHSATWGMPGSGSTLSGNLVTFFTKIALKCLWRVYVLGTSDKHTIYMPRKMPANCKLNDPILIFWLRAAS